MMSLSKKEQEIIQTGVKNLEKRCIEARMVRIKMKSYGKELILDIHNCNVSKFNRTDIERYIRVLCNDVIDMEREDLHWWDFEDDIAAYHEAPSHLKGTSCVQFISTSTIVIHSLVDLKKIFINIFSCKDFDPEMATVFTEKYFGGKVETYEVITRQ